MAVEGAWVWRVVFVLWEQQEPFSSTAEWHIPTGSLITNKNNNTILHCVWRLLLQPVWTRRPLLLAFVTTPGWPQEAVWGKSGAQSLPLGLAACGLRHTSDVTQLLFPQPIKGIIIYINSVFLSILSNL